MTYEFGSMLYRNSREMHIAIAEHWLVNRAEAKQSLSDRTDQELTDEFIVECNWDCGPEFSRNELLSAFGKIRSDFDNRFPE